MASDDFDLIVGVDFGTTGSAVAYRFNGPGATSTDLLGYYETPKNDPAGSNFNLKIPSILAYAEDNMPPQSTAWGFQAIQSSDSIAAWFKLFFQQRLDITRWGTSDQDWAFSRGIMHLPEGKTPTNLVSDFLRYLLEHLTTFLEPQLAMRHKNWSNTKIKFCFTVPNLWSLEARAEMASAIEKAGIGRKGDCICLLTEAEAAMTFLLSKRQETILKPGNRIIICDCGGGTVDIASYLIAREENSYNELTRSSGGLCGSTAVDRAFYRLMIERFGRSFSDMPSAYIGPKSSFMEKWEKVKCSFTGYDHSKVYKLRLEMLLDDVPEVWYNRKSSVLISGADLQAVFHDAVKEIIILLQAQIEDTNQTAGNASSDAYKIVLVGGFACSPYLQAEIKRVFDHESNERPNMVHYMYNNMFTAIALGAAEWGTGKFRSERLIMNCHYGVRSSQPMDFLHDQGIMPVRGISNLDFYMNKQDFPIDWIIQKDQQMKLGNPIRHNGLLYHRKGESMNKIINIYGSDQDPPPTSDHESGVFILSRVNFDISKVDLSHCQRREIEDRVIWCIVYQLSVELTECGKKLRYAVSSQGIELGDWVARPGIIEHRA